MNRKSIVTTLAVVSLMLVSAYSMAMPLKPPKQDKDGIKVVEVDKVAQIPEAYKGYFGIEGDVLKVYASEKKFFLSCGDSCVRLPVKYEGELPKEKSKIIAYGEIRISKEGYIFAAEKVDLR